MSETTTADSEPVIADESNSEIQELEQLEQAELNERDDGAETVEQEASTETEDEYGNLSQDELREQLREANKRLRNKSGALAEERGIRKELQDYQRQQEQRWSELQSKLPPVSEENEETLPDLQSDPLGHITKRFQSQELSIKEMRDRIGQYQQVFERQQQYSALERYAINSEATFSQEQPDYYDAREHYKASRTAEIQKLFGADDEQAEQVLTGELATLAQQASQTGASPAAAIYEAAKLRGYAPKSDKAEKTLKQMGEGRKMSPSMPAGGKGKDNALSVEALTKLEGDEFSKAWEKAERQGLFG